MGDPPRAVVIYAIIRQITHLGATLAHYVDNLLSLALNALRMALNALKGDTIKGQWMQLQSSPQRSLRLPVL